MTIGVQVHVYKMNCHCGLVHAINPETKFVHHWVHQACQIVIILWKSFSNSPISVEFKQNPDTLSEFENILRVGCYIMENNIDCRIIYVVYYWVVVLWIVFWRSSFHFWITLGPFSSNHSCLHHITISVVIRRWIIVGVAWVTSKIRSDSINCCCLIEKKLKCKFKARLTVPYHITRSTITHWAEQLKFKILMINSKFMSKQISEDMTVHIVWAGYAIVLIKASD